MISDTNFLSRLHGEQQAGMQGPAAVLPARHRQALFLITVISLGQVAVIFREQSVARKFLARYRTLRLTPEVAYTAALIEWGCLHSPEFPERGVPGGPTVAPVDSGPG